MWQEFILIPFYSDTPNSSATNALISEQTASWRPRKTADMSGMKCKTGSGFQKLSQALKNLRSSAQSTHFYPLFIYGVRWAGVTGQVAKSITEPLGDEQPFIPWRYGQLPMKPKIQVFGLREEIAVPGENFTIFTNCTTRLPPLFSPSSKNCTMAVHLNCE